VEGWSVPSPHGAVWVYMGTHSRAYPLREESSYNVLSTPVGGLTASKTS
jgi:hypothetical protein